MRHRVLIGCNYPGADGKPVRREPGDVVDDITPEIAAAFGGVPVLVDADAPVESSSEEPDDDEPEDEDVVCTEAGNPIRPLAYHAEDGKAYHSRSACPVGNNIEPATRRLGTGDLKKCRDCARLERAEKE